MKIDSCHLTSESGLSQSWKSEDFWFACATNGLVATLIPDHDPAP